MVFDKILPLYESLKLRIAVSLFQGQYTLTLSARPSRI